MNKKVKFALVGATLIMGACADYSVDSDDTMVKTSNPGNGTRDVAYYVLPEDYDLDTYLTLNPDVKYYQIINKLRNQDNKPRLDSMNGETKTDATALYNADNEAFLADEALAKKAFLMAGYPESMWAGSEALDKEQKAVILRYNKQQIGGAPSSADDKAYIDNFQYDPELYQMHYAAFGILEGRAYRICKAADITIPKGYSQSGKTVVSKEESDAKPLVTIVNLADTLGARPRMMDYSAYYFCKNEADGRTYPIWNDEGGERLVRIREVQDSLLAANPPEPAETEPATEEKSSSEEKESSSESSSETTEEQPAEESTTEESSTEESGTEESGAEESSSEESTAEEPAESGEESAEESGETPET
jgi:hypothetical protein